MLSAKSRLPTGEPQELGALGKLIAITQFGPKPFWDLQMYRKISATE
jgi:hypothetical protein